MNKFKEHPSVEKNYTNEEICGIKKEDTTNKENYKVLRYSNSNIKQTSVETLIEDIRNYKKQKTSKHFEKNVRKNSNINVKKNVGKINKQSQVQSTATSVQHTPSSSRKSIRQSGYSIKLSWEELNILNEAALFARRRRLKTQRNNKNKSYKLYGSPHARELPKTQLTNFIEEQLNLMMMRNNIRRQICVREVSSSEETYPVLPRMNVRYQDTYPENFKYIQRAIYCFDYTSGVDVWFMGFYVHEYGSQCPEPNRGHIYIMNLDSVKTMQQPNTRTLVYHTIIIGYLQYAKSLGFLKANVCVSAVPYDDPDTLMYQHPQNQKIPDFDRLMEWYKHLFKKGKEEGVFLNIKTLSQVIEESHCIKDIQYLEHSPIPELVEDILLEFKNSRDENCLKLNLLEKLKRDKKELGNIDQKNAQIKKERENASKSARIKARGRERVSRLELGKYEYFVMLLNELPSDKINLRVEKECLLPCDFVLERETLLKYCKAYNLGFWCFSKAVKTTSIIVNALQNWNIHVKLTELGLESKFNLKDQARLRAVVIIPNMEQNHDCV